MKIKLGLLWRRYPGHDRIDAITWTFNQKHSYMFSLWYLLSSPVNRVEIEFLPVYTPSQEEQLRYLQFLLNCFHVSKC